MLSLTAEYQADATVGAREIAMSVSDAEGNLKCVVPIFEPIANEVVRLSWSIGQTYTVTNNIGSQAMPVLPLEIGDVVTIFDDQAVSAADVLVQLSAVIVLLE